jgi:hypothetical protein
MWPACVKRTVTAEKTGLNYDAHGASANFTSLVYRMLSGLWAVGSSKEIEKEHT